MPLIVVDKGDEWRKYRSPGVEESWHGDEAEGLMLEARLQGQLIGSANQVEAVKSNFEERPPEYVDP